MISWLGFVRFSNRFHHETAAQQAKLRSSDGAAKQGGRLSISPCGPCYYLLATELVNRALAEHNSSEHAAPRRGEEIGRGRDEIRGGPYLGGSEAAGRVRWCERRRPPKLSSAEQDPPQPNPTARAKGERETA